MNTPYWLDGLEPLSRPLVGPVEADILLVGGWLCGASAALALA